MKYKSYVFGFSFVAFPDMAQSLFSLWSMQDDVNSKQLC